MSTFPPEPGQGGPGHSWFTIDVVSDPVEPGAFPWPEPQVIQVTDAAAPDSGQFVHAGPLWETVEVEGRFRFVQQTLAFEQALLPISFRFVKSQNVKFAGHFELSNFMHLARAEDEEFDLLFG